MPCSSNLGRELNVSRDSLAILVQFIQGGATVYRLREVLLEKHFLQLAGGLPSYRHLTPVQW